MNISPIDRVYAHIAITATDSTGATVSLTSVDVAALPFRADPTAATSWVAAPVTNGAAQVLVAGPAADPSGAIPIPVSGARLWMRVTSNPEVQAVPLDFVSVS